MNVELLKNTRRVRFGTFEIDLQTGELRRSGIRVRLQEQPFKVLATLLERPGELVTRDELRQRLWTDADFGDFDQGINVAIKKLRTALGDSAENPRFIETLARRGYRFIAPITPVEDVNPFQARPAAAPDSVSSPVALIQASKSDRRSRRWTLAAVAVILLVVAGILLWRRPHQYSLGVSGLVDFRLAPLTGSLGFEFDPQFSPDGKQIAYVWADGQKSRPDIYVKVLGAGNPVRLLPPQENVIHILPTWSPDGRFIACVRAVRIPDPPPDPKLSVAERLLKQRQQRRANAAVYQIPAVGGEEKKLFDVDFVTDLKWSPDGKWLLLAMRSNPEEPVSLYRYSLDGTERKRLTHPPANYEGDTIPEFSPDGKYIAFSRNISSGGADVFIMPVAGGEPRRITFDAHHVRGLSFTADGSEIVYSSARKSGTQRALWRVPVRGGNPVRLPFGTNNADSPVISRVGNHLAYIQAIQSTTIWAYSIPQSGEKPQEPAKLIASRQVQVGPQYSPDGKRIVFTSDRSGSWELWVSNSDGSSPIQLTSFGDRQTGTPRWSPDGKLITFDARPEKRSDIFVMDSAGGKPRALTNGPKDSVVPSFSRDGKWIYFSSNANGSWDLYKMPVDGTAKPIQLTTQGGFSAFESADGHTLYYSKFDKPGIYSMPLPTGPESLVTLDLLPRLWGAWSLRDDGIYLITPQQVKNTSELYPALTFYDFSTHKLSVVRALNDGPNPGPAMSISPDGKTMLYVQPDKTGAEIMIVDNFR